MKDSAEVSTKSLLKDGKNRSISTITDRFLVIILQYCSGKLSSSLILSFSFPFSPFSGELLQETAQNLVYSQLTLIIVKQTAEKQVMFRCLWI